MTAHVVYRVANKEGVGPYRGEAGRVGYLHDRPNGTDYCMDVLNAPRPSLDGLPHPKGQVRFGFKSLQALRAWFWRDRYMLWRAGMRIHKVYALRVVYGRKQVIFDPESVIS